MPKETIHAGGYDVEVTWGRDTGDIQVATVIRPPTEPTTSAPLPDGRVAVAETPASLGTLVESWSPEERYLHRGLYALISDRASVNDLIRVLRRARDQSFGRDE